MAATESKKTIYGNNNATLGPVPENDQVFKIEFLEIAPLPIPVDRVFFTYLRGFIESNTISNADLANATLSITMSVIYPDGSHGEKTTHTTPLRTNPFRNMIAHIAIRNSNGVHVDFLTVEEGSSQAGQNDILTDMWIPGMFLETGEWRFEVLGSLADGTCLFNVEFRQWLEGERTRTTPSGKPPVNEHTTEDIGGKEKVQ